MKTFNLNYFKKDFPLMKHFIFSIILLFSAATFAAPHQPEKPQTKKAETKVETQTDVQVQGEVPPATYVYVCTGPYAKKYHSHENCTGLNACSGEKVKITLEQAERNGKTPCKTCFGN